MRFLILLGVFGALFALLVAFGLVALVVGLVLLPFGLFWAWATRASRRVRSSTGRKNVRVRAVSDGSV